MIIPLLILAASLALLIKSADWLVEGASSIAKHFGISALVIGLTVVAFGTSMPELAVNIISVLKGNTELAIGNIVGSNIANILLILGISALIRELTVKSVTVWREIPMALGAAIILFVMASDLLIGFYNGVLLIILFGFFLYYIYLSIKTDTGTSEEEIVVMPTGKSVLLTLGGIAGLVIAGKLLVDSAITIATVLGISESIIGLTVVAVGTSLPELATSAVAAYRGKVDIAIGNVVGSNIFNVLWILGLSAVIRPLPLLVFDDLSFLTCIAATLLLFGVLFIGKRHVLERWQGGFFVLLYVVYVAFLVLA